MNRKKRIIAKAIFAVLTAVMLFACKPEGEKVTGVVLDHRELKADIGQTVTLTATVLPAEAANPKVSWEAVPKGIVELTPDGALCTVKAVKDGAAVVTVTTEDGGFTATCTVTVSLIAAESVELDQKELNLIVGDPAAETATLTATVFPENAADKTVSWNAVPKGVVELTVDGAVCTVKALEEGTAVVMVTAADGRFTAICTVTVPPVLPESIELDREDLNLILGNSESDTATLTATVFPENTTDKRIRWTVFPEDVVSLRENEDGSCTVKAVGTGVATVIVASVDNPTLTAVCRISVDYLYLTNTAFIKAVDRGTTNPVSVGWIKESNGTVKLTPENMQKIRAVTELNLDGSGFSSEERLKDLGGIEYFTGLTYLHCGSNNLTELDVSALTFLEYLNCSNNNLTTLDVSINTALTTLDCYQNKLTTLGVSDNNTALTYLSCSNNNLNELGVSNLWKLTDLLCSNNNLNELDVSNLRKLTVLSCSNNNLNELDVSKNTALTELICDDNNLTKLDVSKLKALISLSCSNNNLTELNAAYLGKLESLYCSNNALTELRCPNMYESKLVYLYCYSNKLTKLYLPNWLETLYCYDNQLTELDITSVYRLKQLNCTNQHSAEGTEQKLTLKLTRDQKYEFRLEEGEFLKLEIH